MFYSKKDTMNLLRKLLGFLFLIFLFAGIYLMLSGEQSKDVFIRKEQISNTVHNVNINGSNSREKDLLKKVTSYIDSKDLNSLKGYIADEVKFGNIKEIEKLTEAELNELAKLGIKREKSDYVILPKERKKKKNIKEGIKLRTEMEVEKEGHSPENNQLNESTNKIKLTDNLSGTNVKMKYKFRNPRRRDIAKLSKKQLEIELETDPLSSSAVCDNDQTFLTVLVVSAPSNFLRRQFIRDTWANSYIDDVKLLKQLKPMGNNEKSIPLKSMFRSVFVLGQTEQGTHMKEVHEEAKLNKDIIFGNLIEDYTNLTMKTRLALKWAFYDCNSVYTVKTDDDVFVNPVMITEWLKEMPRNNFYTGWCNFNSPVVRNPNSKWYVSRKDFGPSNYPGYCLGGGYLMSNDVLGKVISMSYGRDLFPMEDLYVGLMIDQMKEVKIQDEKKHFDLVYGGRSNDCELNDLFLAHQVFGQALVSHIKRARKAMTSCG